MTTRELIVREARSYIGTPFHHQARLPGVGLDCVGLVVCVARVLGLNDADCSRYPRRPNGMLIPELLRGGYREIELGSEQPGDIVCFWILPKSRKPAHLGIRTDRGIVHTDARARRVVEVGFVGEWRERACAAFAFPGVD